MRNRRKPVPSGGPGRRWGWLFAFIPVLAVAAVLVSLFYRLPADRPFVPRSEASEIVEVPRRPGIYGILIDIPQEKPNVFSIDLLRSEPVDWRQLQIIDYRADVRVYAMIGSDGRISVSDVIDVDHARAGRFIVQAVRSWVYKPLKSGRVVFHFNLPSEGEKLIIYTSGLKRNPDIDREIPVLDGRLHNVAGIDPSLVRVVK
jgi:hypothetical protein